MKPTAVLRADDLLILIYPEHITPETAARVKAAVEKRVTCEVLVITGATAIVHRRKAKP